MLVLRHDTMADENEKTKEVGPDTAMQEKATELLPFALCCRFARSGYIWGWVCFGGEFGAGPTSRKSAALVALVAQFFW